MDKTTVKLIAAAALIGLGTQVAIAQDGRGGGPRMDFATLDADGNGQIEESDLDALRAERFAALDTDGDGAISEAEFVAHAAERAGERAAEMFSRLDADGDGMVSRDAVEARQGRGMGERLLRRADADNSGGVSEEEFDAAMEHFAERRGGGHEGRGDRWGKGHRN
ncbi:calcium-binding protein [Alphaproteobacteria bacterium GH1-50]|uniref:Calcium-binding protein n=1 Tax=Kangsaoukella pontilimi TaxID=2691042 RepID=A0A7C9MXU3_9RHOB|nr:EF-hand domain-containing protein [Kangsaoukella pontilimi]MXQ06318.1 calcium-binding protein [Kangsaoukella pontilimi]